MKTIDINYILAIPPYFDVSTIPNGWTGSVVDFAPIAYTLFGAQKALWLCMRQDLLSQTLMRNYAIWCAQQIENFASDARSLSAITAAQAYIAGTGSAAQMQQAFIQALVANMDASALATAQGGQNQTLNAAWDAARCCSWVANSDQSGIAFSNCARSALNCANRLGGIQGVDEPTFIKQFINMLQSGIATGDVL